MQTTINFALYGAYLVACISISFLLIVIWSEMKKKRTWLKVAQQDDFLVG